MPPGQALCGVAIYVCGLVGEMQDEPKLDARVGDSEVNVVGFGEIDCLTEERVLVDIEYTPDLIVGTPLAASLGLLLGIFGLNGPLDECKGSAMEFMNLDVDSSAKPSVPVLEVVLLGDLTLGKDKQLAPARPGRDRSARPSHYSSESPTGSAICSRRRRERIGVPP